MRRRRWALLLVLFPAMLGAATFGYVWHHWAPPPENESPATPLTLQASPAIVTPEAAGDHSVTAAGGTIDTSAPASAPRADTEEKPGTGPDAAPAAARPAHADNDDAHEVIGPPLVASTDDASVPASPRIGDDAFRLARAETFQASGVTHLRGGGGGGQRESKQTPSGTQPSPETPSGETPSGETPSGETPSGAGGGNDEHVNNDEQNGSNDEQTGNKGENGGDEHDESVEHDETPPVVQVPEPASFSLLLLGLAGCAVRRKRAARMGFPRSRPVDG